MIPRPLQLNQSPISSGPAYLAHFNFFFATIRIIKVITQSRKTTSVKYLVAFDNQVLTSPVTFHDKSILVEKQIN